LVPWNEEHFPVLRACNTGEMTRHLGRAETNDELLERHARYLRCDESTQDAMFAILADGEAVCSIGFWPVQHDGEPVLETGWSVVPSWQRQGVARQALRLCISEARRVAKARRRLFAYPSRDNVASNALCRSAGFVEIGERDFEFREHTLRTKIWVLELDGPNGPDHLTAA
jgi:RimJ/RimL family protein N-acetyltransferase